MNTIFDAFKYRAPVRLSLSCEEERQTAHPMYGCNTPAPEELKRTRVPTLMTQTAFLGGLVPEATAKEPRHDLEQALVRVLASLPFMISPGSRQLFVRKLADSVGDGFTVEEHSSPRTHAIAIVTECFRHQHGLDWLVQQLELFAPDDAATIEAAGLVRTFAALDVVPRPQRLAAHDLLHEAEGTGILDVEAIWYAATDEMAPLPANDTQSLVSAFDQLTGLNARPDGLPPALAFIEYVAARLLGQLAGQLRQWNDNEAAQMGLGSELSALRREAARTPLPKLAPPCLVIQMEEHPILAGCYVITPWTQYRPGPWHPVQGEAQTVRAQDAGRVVDEMVGRAEAAWGARADRRVQLEFALPLPLLNEPVEWWLSNLGTPGATPLCMLYPVIVRSLDRMRRPRLHRVWRNRWATMASSPAINRHWILEDPNARDAWNYELQLDESISAVAFPRPPKISSADAQDQLWIAVHAGVPVMIWDRREQRSAEFETLVDLLAEGPPMRLLERLRILRAEAAGINGEGSSNHSRRHITILWDDPTHLVDISPYPMTPVIIDNREVSGNGH